jgi:hypothetical protein
MAYLTRSEMSDKIISVLRDFDDFYQLNEKYFSNNISLTKDAVQNRSIINNRELMTDMLRKLNDEALVQMYRECGTLTKKYALSSKRTMIGYENTKLATKTIIDNKIYYADIKNPNYIIAGWNDEAPQAICGYADIFDKKSNEMIFNIHATRFLLYNGMVLRLWKGCYIDTVGGEIGIYGESRSITNKEMKGKVAETTAKFLRFLRRRISDNDEKKIVEELKNLSSERWRERIVEIVLSLDKDLKRNLVSSKSNWLLSLSADMPPVPENVAARLMVIKQMINLIEEIIKIIEEQNVHGDVFSEEWGHSLDHNEMISGLGIEGMAVQIFRKQGNRLIAERREYDSGFWATTFRLEKKGNKEILKEEIYTVNHFYFANEEFAKRFCESVKEGIHKAYEYEENKGEKIGSPIIHNKTVIIIYGKE